MKRGLNFKKLNIFEQRYANTHSAVFIVLPLHIQRLFLNLDGAYVKKIKKMNVFYKNSYLYILLFDAHNWSDDSGKFQNSGYPFQTFLFVEYCHQQKKINLSSVLNVFNGLEVIVS